MPQSPTDQAGDKLAVLVRSRDGVLFEGEAYAVTAINAKGLFDVLPRHSNFISFVRDKVVVTKLDRTKEEFPIQSGVMKVAGNDVAVYLGVLGANIMPSK
jgi:F0F1-type ATP synthase epsilon subunit